MANFHKIVDSRTQTVFDLESNATTLGELKQELIDRGYTLNNCIFQEGKTKTEFKSDDALLPTNVSYRGTVTNDLIFRISVSKGKIDSGNSEVPAILAGMEGTIEDIQNGFCNLSDSFDALGNQVNKLKTALLREQESQNNSACSGTAKTSEYDKLNDMFDFDNGDDF